MPQHKPAPTREEILRSASEFFMKSLELKKEIERLPIQFRDTAIHLAIAPFLSGGEGITPRRIVILRERVLRELVKRYFRRQGYQCYTDEELWVRKRRYEGGYEEEEEYPMPDVFARKPTQLVVAEVKNDTSAKSVRNCIRKLTESLKFANRVYAAFSLARPFSAKNVGTFSHAVPDAGVLLVDPSLKGIVREIRAAKERRPPDQRKWNEYYYHFDRARARSVRKRFISLRLTKREKERIERWANSGAPLEYPDLEDLGVE